MEPTAPAAPALPAAPRAGWAPLLLSLGLGAALCADQIRLALLARSAPAAHLLEIPPLWFWVPASALFAACGAAGLWGMAAGASPQLSKVPRLGAALVAFCYAFVLPAVRPPSALFDFALPIQALAEAVLNQSQPGVLQADPAQLADFVAQLPPPPMFVRGVRVEHWHLLVRDGCTGPIDQAPGTEAATFLYCVATDRRRGWLTVVGLSGTSLGQPEVVRDGAQVVFRALDAPAAEDAGER